VHQKGHAIGAELYIALKHAVAVAGTQAKSGQGVFWRQFAGAAVGNPAWIGP
jgi:hypothetical protein